MAASRSSQRADVIRALLVAALLTAAYLLVVRWGDVLAFWRSLTHG